MIGEYDLDLLLRGKIFSRFWPWRLSESGGAATLQDLFGNETSGDSVRDNSLTRLKNKSLAVEGDLDLVQLERDDGEPGNGTQLAVLTRAVLSDEDTGSDIGRWEERDRVEAWLVEQEHVLAVCYPLTSEHDSQPSAKGFSKQELFREHLGGEEPPRRRSTQRTLLPR